MFQKYRQFRMVRFSSHNSNTFDEQIHEVYRNEKIRVTVEITWEDDWGGGWMPVLITVSQDESLNSHTTLDGKSFYGNIIFKRIATPCAPITMSEVEDVLDEYMNATFHTT